MGRPNGHQRQDQDEDVVDLLFLILIILEMFAMTPKRMEVEEYCPSIVKQTDS